MAARWDLTKEEYESQEALAEQLGDTDPDDVDCEVEEHPEGSKRGGYVPVHYGENGARVFWDCTDCTWVPYDNEG